jgi:hypothetical protein
MIRVARTAIAADGTPVTIELTLGQTGGEITKTHGDVVQEMASYSLDEFETIFELMEMLRPKYKTGS